MPDLSGGIRAPSTPGSHLRSCTWGNVRQLEIVNRELLGELARRAPLLPGKDTLAFIDIDAMQKRVYGHQKQGAGFAIAHNLLRAAGSLASLAYGKARGATIRRDLIDVAARTARHGGGHLTPHLPGGWHREHEWTTLFAAACGPPLTAA